ncbi:hypothetical protein V5O48_004002 [Marasmius crinis-equi]|uniref:Uncharacterized protein n=1 Tax=Marasmius crinis-equi TaxID=585013 RepID=A0ABR3FRA2_9AGAR
MQPPGESIKVIKTPPVILNSDDFVNNPAGALAAAGGETVIRRNRKQPQKSQQRLPNTQFSSSEDEQENPDNASIPTSKPPAVTPKRHIMAEAEDPTGGPAQEDDQDDDQDDGQDDDQNEVIPKLKPNATAQPAGIPNQNRTKANKEKKTAAKHQPDMGVAAAINFSITENASALEEAAADADPNNSKKEKKKKPKDRSAESVSEPSSSKKRKKREEKPKPSATTKPNLSAELTPDRPTPAKAQRLSAKGKATLKSPVGDAEERSVCAPTATTTASVSRETVRQEKVNGRIQDETDEMEVDPPVNKHKDGEEATPAKRLNKGKGKAVQAIETSDDREKQDHADETEDESPKPKKASKTPVDPVASTSKDSNGKTGKKKVSRVKNETDAKQKKPAASKDSEQQSASERMFQSMIFVTCLLTFSQRKVDIVRQNAAINVKQYSLGFAKVDLFSQRGKLGPRGPQLATFPMLRSVNDSRVNELLQLYNNGGFHPQLEEHALIVLVDRADIDESSLVPAGFDPNNLKMAKWTDSALESQADVVAGSHRIATMTKVMEDPYQSVRGWKKELRQPQLTDEKKSELRRLIKQEEDLIADVRYPCVHFFDQGGVLDAKNGKACVLKLASNNHVASKKDSPEEALTFLAWAHNESQDAASKQVVLDLLKSLDLPVAHPISMLVKQGSDILDAIAPLFTYTQFRHKISPKKLLEARRVTWGFQSVFVQSGMAELAYVSSGFEYQEEPGEREKFEARADAKAIAAIISGCTGAESFPAAGNIWLQAVQEVSSSHLRGLQPLFPSDVWDSTVQKCNQELLKRVEELVEQALKAHDEQDQEEYQAIEALPRKAELLVNRRTLFTATGKLPGAFEVPFFSLFWFEMLLDHFSTYVKQYQTILDGILPGSRGLGDRQKKIQDFGMQLSASENLLQRLRYFLQFGIDPDWSTKSPDDILEEKPVLRNWVRSCFTGIVAILIKERADAFEGISEAMHWAEDKDIAESGVQWREKFKESKAQALELWAKQIQEEAKASKRPRVNRPDVTLRMLPDPPRAVLQLLDKGLSNAAERDKATWETLQELVVSYLPLLHINALTGKSPGPPHQLNHQDRITGHLAAQVEHWNDQLQPLLQNHPNFCNIFHKIHTYINRHRPLKHYPSFFTYPSLDEGDEDPETDKGDAPGPSSQQREAMEKQHLLKDNQLRKALDVIRTQLVAVTGVGVEVEGKDGAVLHPAVADAYLNLMSVAQGALTDSKNAEKVSAGLLKSQQESQFDLHAETNPNGSGSLCATWPETKALYDGLLYSKGSEPPLDNSETGDEEMDDQDVPKNSKQTRLKKPNPNVDDKLEVSGDDEEEEAEVEAEKRDGGSSSEEDEGKEEAAAIPGSSSTRRRRGTGDEGGQEDGRKRRKLAA